MTAAFRWVKYRVELHRMRRAHCRNCGCPIPDDSTQTTYTCSADCAEMYELERSVTWLAATEKS